MEDPSLFIIHDKAEPSKLQTVRSANWKRPTILDNETVVITTVIVTKEPDSANTSVSIPRQQRLATRSEDEQIIFS